MFKDEPGYVNPDPNLSETLRGEGPGILAWLLEGGVNCLRHGLPDIADIEDATKTYRQEKDPLSPFIEDCCNLKDGAWASRAAVWHSYQKWAAQNKQRIALSRNQFFQCLRQHGFHDANRTVEGKTVRVFTGVQLYS